MKQSLRIEKFNRMLQAESQPSPMLDVLRRVTLSSKKAASRPKPLGSWAGWSY
jgi:hypothetical protein